ncbi:GGDEF domain-containing protein [Aminivibrio sp.]
MRQDFLQMIDVIKETALLLNPDRKVIFWNKAAERLTGFRKEDMIGSLWRDNILVHEDKEGRDLSGEGFPLLLTLMDKMPRKAEIFIRHRRGFRIPVSLWSLPFEDEDGQVVGAIELLSEINPERNIRLRMEELERNALLDPLTKVPSRRHLDAELAALFTLWEKRKVPFGVLFLDIDHFKRFNDTWGHDVGDEVLIAVGRALLGSVRPFDILGRWGGEEFLGLFPNITRDFLETIGERLRSVVEKTELETGGERLSVTLSIGGTSTVRGDTAAEMVRRADALMYESKKAGRNRVTIG